MTGVVVAYLERTGRLSIFADSTSAPGLATVSGSIDLTKGISVGDSSTTVLVDEAGTWLTLTKGASQGTAQYDVGHPDITALQRFKPLPTPPQAASTRASVQFAGSFDGVAYGRFSEPQQIAIGTDLPEAIDLTTMLVPNSHFVRVLLTLATEDLSVSPRFAGFSINYELALASQTSASGGTGGTVSADPIGATSITVNNTVAGSTEAPPTAITPKDLAATGTGDVVIVLVLLTAIGGAFLLLGSRGFRK